VGTRTPLFKTIITPTKEEINSSPIMAMALE